MELDGRVCLITGASGGIGEALGDELAAAGAKVILVARRGDRLKNVAARIGAESSIAVTGDVTKKADMEAAVAAGIERFGRLDALINNAGIAVRGPLTSMPQELMEQGLWVNVIGPVLATQAALPALLDAGGMIVNVSSGVSLFPDALMGVYTSSKAAMNLISASLREELRDKGIHVMTVHPGWIDNDFRTNSLYSDDSPKPDKLARPQAGGRTSADAARDIVEAMRSDQKVLLCGPEYPLEIPL